MYDVPVIILPGTEDSPWYNGFNWSQSLDRVFPDQDAWDFCQACSYNNISEDNFESGIVELEMIQQGENDGENWIWRIKLANGREFKIEGWCDYTGWDCQSQAWVVEE